MKTKILFIIVLLTFLSGFDLAAKEIKDRKELAQIENRWISDPGKQDFRSSSGTIKLTEKEKTWLKNNPIVRARVGPAPPLHFFDGEYKGISVDYLNLIAERVGFQIKYITDIPWPVALDYIKNRKKIDLILTAKITQERKQYTSFTKNYLLMPLVIFSKTDAAFISNLDDLNGKTISVERGYVIHKKLENEFPEIRLLITKTSKEAIEAVASGLADAYVGNLTIGTYIIQQNNFNNIKVAAPTPFDNHNQAMAVRNDWPELVSIINKTLESLTPEEHAGIRNNWLIFRYEYGITKTDILKWFITIFVFAMTIILLIMFWNRKLKKEVILHQKSKIELRKNENKFRQIYNNILDVYYEAALDGIILEISPSVEKHSQYKREELVGKSLYDIYANPAEIDKLINILIKKGSLRDYEISLVDKDGTLRINSLNVELIKDEKNNPKKLIGIFRDITERIQAGEKLRKSEEKFKRIFNNLQDGYFWADTDGHILLANQFAADTLGYDLKELMQKNMAQDIYFNPEERKTVKKTIIQNGKIENCELAFRKKNGQKIIVEANSHLVYYDNQQKSMEGTFRDITAQKQAEDALRENEKKYRTLFDMESDAIALIDVETENMLEVNKSFINLYGYNKEEVLQMKNTDFLTVTDKIQKAAREHKESIPVRWHKKKDGTVFPAEITANTFNYQGKDVFIAAIRDITERNKTEEEKTRAYEYAAKQEKHALIGQIAGKMAHDFNNILSIIMGNTELSLLDCKDAEIKKTLELIFEQTLRGRNLTKNLVAFAKDQEPKQQFFPVNKKIELVLNLLKKDLEGIDEVKEAGHGIPDLLADPGMIEHALVNLVQNSIHATSMIKQPRIIIRTFHRDKTVYIEIEDNGCGIPEKALDRIYEPAFTMKGSSDITKSYKPGIKGTGYGMANVKKYIEQHKGNIVITSKVGEGTKITISLPVIKKELTEKEIIEIRKETFYCEKYILLVEDEQAISDVQYKILTNEPCNHKVDIETNGQMAIDLFTKNRYDFISLDYDLSGELNGMDVYHHVRKTNKTVPILFVSGNIEFLESIKELKHKDSNIDHISKPCQNKDYVRAINKKPGLRIHRFVQG